MSEQKSFPGVEPVIERMKGEFPGTSDQLIPMLQYVQNEMNHLPSQAMAAIADYIKVPASHVYGVATFYAQFRFKPLGRNVITICRGTACHVRGSGRLLEELERELGIKAGDTTDDLEFSIETVACVGSCALAPLAVINNKVYGKMTARAAKRIIKQVGAGKQPRAPAEKTEPKKEKVKPAPPGPAPVKESRPKKQAAKPKKIVKKKVKKVRIPRKKAAKKKAMKKKPVKQKAAEKKKKLAKKKAGKKKMKPARKKAAKKSAVKSKAQKKRGAKKKVAKRRAGKKAAKKGITKNTGRGKAAGKKGRAGKAVKKAVKSR